MTKRKRSDEKLIISPSSFVFLQVKANKHGIIQALSLTSAHVSVLRQESAPRILDKLTFCFVPPSTLFNENSANQIEMFIQLQAQPVCLVALNGVHQFSTLGNAFGKLGKSLPFDTLCAGLSPADFRLTKEQFDAESSSIEFINYKMCLLFKDNFERTYESMSLELFSSFVRIPTLPRSNVTLRSQMQRNNTFIFFSLQLTGLESQQITELCMIAIQEEQFLSANVDSWPDLWNKIILVVDPKTKIGDVPKVEELTKLSNTSIEESKKKTFSNAAQLIRQFINCCGSSTCLIAQGCHTGMPFDVLRAHLFKALGSGLKLFNQLEKLDTYFGFKKLKNCSGKNGLLKLYSHFFFGQSIPDHHLAEAKTIALMKITKACPEVLTASKRELFVTRSSRIFLKAMENGLSCE